MLSTVGHINRTFQSITQLVILKSFLKSKLKCCQERPGFERQIKKHHVPFAFKLFFKLCIMTNIKRQIWHIKHMTHDTDSSAKFPLGTLPLKFGNRNFKGRVLSGEPNVYFHPKISSNFYECIIRWPIWVVFRLQKNPKVYHIRTTV